MLASVQRATLLLSLLLLSASASSAQDRGWTLTRVTEGFKALEKKIECGETKGVATVHTGVSVQVTIKRKDPRGRNPTHTYKEAFSLSYRADRVGTCSWIGFFWAEVLVTRGQEEKPIKVTINTTAGSIQSSDRRNPVLYVDSRPRARTPSYENGRVHERSATQIQVFDRPSPYVPMQFLDPAVKRIRYRVHFESVLACDGMVCLRLPWVVEWSWVPQGKTPREREAEATRIIRDPHAQPYVLRVLPELQGAKAKLTKAQAAALKARFPSQTLIDLGQQ